jgi:hypothetical protein
MSTERYSGYRAWLRDSPEYIATGYDIAHWIMRLATEWYSGHKEWLRYSRVDIATVYVIVHWI